MTETYDLTIKQGTDWEQVVYIKNSDGTEKSLAGYSARMQARASVDDSATFINLTIANSGVVLETNSETGRVDLQLTNTQTSALTTFSGVYDLELVLPDTTVDRVLQGNITVDREVTR